MRTQDALEQLKIIDPPSIPYAPRGPLPILLVLAGVGVGILLGVGVVLLMSFFDRMMGQRTIGASTH
jgi:uncharacterized protein involved in exopolysaccharide biosynthesis